MREMNGWQHLGERADCAAGDKCGRTVQLGTGAKVWVEAGGLAVYCQPCGELRQAAPVKGRECIVCAGPIDADKPAKQVTCGRACGQRLRAQNASKAEASAAPEVARASDL